jgi:hypothetical protein
MVLNKKEFTNEAKAKAYTMKLEGIFHAATRRSSADWPKQRQPHSHSAVDCHQNNKYQKVAPYSQGSQVSPRRSENESYSKSDRCFRGYSSFV